MAPQGISVDVTWAIWLFNMAIRRKQGIVLHSLQYSIGERGPDQYDDREHDHCYCALNLPRASIFGLAILKAETEASVWRPDAKHDGKTDDGRNKETIPASISTAHDLYAKACQSRDLPVGKLKDTDAYDDILAACKQSGEARELPTRATFCRYLRTYRKLTGTQKNTLRAGRNRGIAKSEKRK